MIDVRAAALSAAAVLLSALCACSDSVGPQGSRGVSVAFSTAGTGVHAAVSRGESLDLVVGGGNPDSLVIDTVQVVLRELEMETATGGCAAHDSASVGADDCGELSVGPLLVSLPLSGGLGAPLSATVPAGTYRAMELELHRPSDDSSDAAFLAAHPQFADASVRATGTYRGERFVFTSAVDAELEMEFSPPLVVDGTTNVTVHVDVASWFRDDVGNTIAPTPNNASSIANRIQASFRAFEDHDRDGDEN